MKRFAVKNWGRLLRRGVKKRNKFLFADREINHLSVKFRDKKKESEFLVWTLPEQIAFFKHVAYIGVGAVMLFAIPDYPKFGMSAQFLYSLTVRGILAVATLVLLSLITKRNRASFFYKTLFVISLLITANTAIVIIVMENHSVTSILSELIAVLAFYVFLPQSFLISMLTGTTSSVLFLTLHMLYGNTGDLDISGILMVYILANAFGVIYSRNNNYLQRKGYINIVNEQSAKKLLVAEIRERKLLEVELLENARTDVLTGLMNRRYFLDLLEQEVLRGDRYGNRFCVIMFDLDDFKKINDTYGHAKGDLALKSFAETCRHNIRKSDILARFGGEEFTLLLPSTRIEEAQMIAEKIRQEISAIVLDPGIQFTVSVGIAQYLDGDSVDALLGRADESLYASKNTGKNKVTCLDPS